MHLFNDLGVRLRFLTHRNRKAGCHPVQIVRVLAHGHDFWNNRLARPIDTKNLGELLEILGGSFSYREDRVREPVHAEIAKLLVKELDAKLRCKKWNVFNDCETNAPLLV